MMKAFRLLPIVLVTSSLSVNATLIGDEVNAELFTIAAGGFSNTTATVGAGIEFTKTFAHPNFNDPPVAWLDIGADFVAFSLFNPVEPSNYNSTCGTPDCKFRGGLLGFEINDLDWVGNSAAEIADVILVNSSFPMSAIADVSFDAHNIDITFDELSTIIPGFGTEWTATWQIVTRNIPEPVTGLLIETGVFGVIWSHRRRASGR